MSAVRHIGRVGALAIAMGAGAMIVSPWAASADSGDSDGTYVSRGVEAGLGTPMRTDDCFGPLCVLMVESTGGSTSAPVTDFASVHARVALIAAVPPTTGADPVSSLIRLFIGNGVDAATDCVGTACNGGNGGLFLGSGGRGANGGNGGHAGLIGNGGVGGAA